MDTSKKAAPVSASAAETHAFPVVGIGASAGGLPALVRLLENLPPAPGMALVVVLHLSPDYPSTADRLLQRATRMPVVQVRQRTPLRQNHVYVISPGLSLAMEEGDLVVDALQYPLGIPITINIFLRALAEAHGANAIGVILSGMGTDGVAGLASVRERGGATMAQLPAEAEEGAMPQAAIASGTVDFVLPASRMAGKLIELREAMHAARREPEAAAPDGLPMPGAGAGGDDAVDKILSLLWMRTGYDFRHYKRPTVLRRIERRLQVRGVPDLQAYHALLERDGDEPKALHQDLLIGVTSFFRDPESFAWLERFVVPRLFQDKRLDEPLRAWVSACSSGEEAYTLAMLLADQVAARSAPPAVQVFASDIDERAIAHARAGRYPAAISVDVAPDRLTRYFMQDGDGFRVRRSLRDLILFTPHNLLQDPAFSRLDLITCRNFLIYLTREMQLRVLELFHAALNPGGYLFLGSAESTEMAPHLFAPVDAGHRVYQARPAARGARRLSVPPAKVLSPVALFERGAAPSPSAPGRTRVASFAEIHRDSQARLAPPSLLVNAHGELLHVGEQAGQFLRHAGGEPSRDVLALIVPDLYTDLRTLLYEARKSGRPARSAPIRIEREGLPRDIRVAVLPCAQEGDDDDLMLVQFEVAAAADAADPSGADGRSGAQVQELEQALRHVRSNLQRTIEEAAASGRELRQANQALEVLADGLRRRIDTLETGTEELQSRNEELYTVNAELQMRIDETARANDDLSNLIASADIATLFLDEAMRIQRYTPRASAIFNLIPADVGRPLAHLTTRLDYPRLAADVAGVLASTQPVEQAVRSTDGRDYIVRVHPYRTVYQWVEGAVLTFFDITERKRGEAALRASETRLADKLAGTALLQDLSTRLAPEQRLEALHEPILDAAIVLAKADAATIQLLDADGEHLRLIASRHILPESQAYWERVDAHHASTCGRVLRTGRRVIVEDVDADPALAGTPDLAELHRCGLRAVQSTPLRARSGRLIGMISTHWQVPRRICEADFRLFDVLVRQLADLIDLAQAEAGTHAAEAPDRGGPPLSR